MITEDELRENGFSKSENDEWINETYTNVSFTFNEGRATYARSGDAYSGLAIRITTMERLLSFLTFLR